MPHPADKERSLLLCVLSGHSTFYSFFHLYLVLLECGYYIEIKIHLAFFRNKEKSNSYRKVRKFRQYCVPSALVVLAAECRPQLAFTWRGIPVHMELTAPGVEIQLFYFS